MAPDCTDAAAYENEKTGLDDAARRLMGSFGTSLPLDRVRSARARFEKRLARHLAQAPARGAAFAGKWDTHWGDMQLSVTGRRVVGSYEHKGGRIFGTLADDGRSFTGKWLHTKDGKAYRRGKLSFALSEDGQSIQGSWNYGDLAPTIGWGYIRRPRSH